MRNKIVIFGSLLVIMMAITGVAVAIKPVVTVDVLNPTETINEKPGQADPTSESPIIFKVVFSENVIDFTGTDVKIEGSAGATTAIVTQDTGNSRTYAVEVSGMTSSGTVITTVPANVVVDLLNNPNNPSTSKDNTVTYNMPAPTPVLGTESWTGQGTSNGALTDVQCDAIQTPYLLWIFTTGGGNPLGTEKLTINSVEYPGSVPSDNAGNVHFTTPFFNLGTLNQLNPHVDYSTSILGTGEINLVISHGCAGPQTSVPEFPTLALPIAAIIGLVFFFQHKKKKEE